MTPDSVIVIGQQALVVTAMAWVSAAALSPNYNWQWTDLLWAAGWSTLRCSV